MKKGKSRKCIGRKNLMRNQKAAAKRFDLRRAYNRTDYDGCNEED